MSKPRSIAQSIRRLETAREYLVSFGCSNEEIIEVLKAFPSGIYTPVSELKALGTDGTKALISAVQRELQQSSAKKAQETPVRVTLRLLRDQRDMHFAMMQGETLYDLVLKNPEVQQYLECACKGIAACSTCHVYVPEPFASKLPPPEDSELDMVDLAWGVKDQSRLGCQIKFSAALDGIVLEVPAQSHNLFSGY